MDGRSEDRGAGSEMVVGALIFSFFGLNTSLAEASGHSCWEWDTIWNGKDMRPVHGAPNQRTTGFTWYE